MERQSDSVSRRQFIERTLQVSGAGILAGLSLEEQALLASAAESSQAPAASLPEQPLPVGVIGKLKVSRLICGGNLFSGFAHSRDLAYVSALMKQYFTDEKIMDTLELCERCGINTTVMRCDEHIVGVLRKYRKERHGKIQWIAQAYPRGRNFDNIKLAVDEGAVAAYPKGELCDAMAAKEQFDILGKAIEFTRSNGLVAGIGAHLVETLQAAQQQQLGPDFYVKTCNSVGYQSKEPEAIGEFMKDVAKPWIAFKVLGAGAVTPQEGFSLALKMGADFLNVGMFDFQVREDVAIMRDLLAKESPRKRPWRS
ncbi:MAG: hypothetical protein ABR915_17845 [Thermoguttaceae bacterium]|jgi:hypothetical protein